MLKTSDTDVVEVDVQANRITMEDQHPVNLLKGSGLSAEKQQKIDSLLQRWREIFLAGDKNFGQISSVLHLIPTGSAHSSRTYYRLIPPSLYPELRGLLQNMLDSDVIRESSSL